MQTWVTIDQVPAEFVPEEKKRIDKKTGAILPPAKPNIMDKIYLAVWGRREKTLAKPSSNAVPIPEEYRLAETEEESDILAE